MSISRKYKMVWGLALILVVLDVWLLQGRVRLHQKVGRLEAGIVQKGNTISDLSATIQFTGQRGAGDDPGLPLRLVAVFTDYGCGHCAKAEIRYLNQWEKQFQHTVQVYLISPAKNLLKSFGAAFPYETISSASSLFTVPLPIGNPLVVLVDENGDIQAIHTNNTNIPGSDLRRAAFYKRMKSLFQSVYGSRIKTAGR